MRCHASMASGFHDYNLKTNYQKKEGGAVPEARARGARVSGAVSLYDDFNKVYILNYSMANYERYLKSARGYNPIIWGK